MTNRREYPAATYVTLRERYAAGGISIRQLAAAHGMPVGTVQNIVSGRKKPMSPEAIARRAERARRVSALGGESVRRQHVEQRPPVGVVAAAIAERESGKPLVVETLERRLERFVPGAVLLEATQQRVTARFAVWRAHACVTGSTAREAVDKAIALWGAR